MGIEIVKAAAVYGRRLSGNAYKVLIAMSLQSLDRPKDGRPASLYFGGWGALQAALGYDEGGPKSAGHTAVKRAVRELRDGKHITPMVTAARGNRQSYLVHPGGIGKGVTSDPQSTEERGSLSDPKRGSDQTLKGGQIPTERGSLSDPPRKEQEGQGLTQDIDLIRRPEPQEAALDAAADEMRVPPHKFNGNPGADCLTCDGAYADRRRHPLHLLRAEGA